MHLIITAPLPRDGHELAELQLRQVADEGQLFSGVVARAGGDGEAAVGAVKLHAPHGDVG